MADQTMRFNIAVNGGDAEAKLKTIAQQLQEIKNQKDTLIQQNSKGSIAGLDYQEKVNALLIKEVSLRKQLTELESLNLGNRDKSLQAEATQRKAIADAERKQAQSIADLRAKQNEASNKQYWVDEENARKRRTNQLRSQMETQAKPQDYQSYAKSVSAARLEAEKLHQVMIQSGTTQSKIDFANAKAGLQHSVKLQEQFNASISTGIDRVGVLGSFSQKLRSHFNWILAGSLIAAFAGIPIAVENIARETEVLGQKIKQNLELAERYRDNHHGLEKDVKHLAEVAGVFSVGYGANLKDTMEMMQILSRRFKSPEELTYYTNLAMVMHKLDFVSPKKSAEDLESVILSMGLDFKGAKRFIDEFSVAVEVAA